MVENSERLKRVAAFAAQFGVWGHATIARTLGVPLSVVKEAGSARDGLYRSSALAFRMDPYSYVAEHVPREILQFLDEGRPAPSEALFGGSPLKCSRAELVSAWRARFDCFRANLVGAPKFNQPIRNGIVYELNRMHDGEFAWNAAAFPAAFSVARSTIDEMRNPRSEHYAEFHEDMASGGRDRDSVYEALRGKYYHALVFGILVETVNEGFRVDAAKYRSRGLRC
jgi:hypothetical protein